MKHGWPSVTQVLSVYADFSGIRPDVLERAAERGTKVHEICSSIAQGLFPGLIPVDLAGYVESFRKWFVLVQEVLLVEERLSCSVYQFTGKPDLAVKLRGDEVPRVIDLKTPLAKGKLWGAQIAGYEHLFKVKTGLDCQHSGTLRLKPDGGFPLFDEYRHSEEDLHAFLCALTAWRYFEVPVKPGTVFQRARRIEADTNVSPQPTVQNDKQNTRCTSGCKTAKEVDHGI